MSNQITPATIINAANSINRLNQLLSWDLATATANHTKVGVMVHLQIQTNRAPISLWLSSMDLEETITKLIETEINNLEKAGIAVDEIINQYKSASLQVIDAQQSKQPLDTSGNP